MSHPTNEQWMEYVYGELDSKRHAELNSHLNDCRECKVKVDTWRSTMAELDKWKLTRKQPVFTAKQNFYRISRWAVAAVLLLAIGYMVGLFSYSRTINYEQLRYALETPLKSSLEPSIKQSMIEELDSKWQKMLANSNTQLKKELDQKLRQSINEFAVQTLTASSAVTNQLLTELILAIDATQSEERRRIMATLGQIELDRLNRDAQIENNLAGLAAYTTDEINRTKQEVANWISYDYGEKFIPNKSKTLTPENERSKK